MPKIYEGHEPYIFVSYAHADKAVVLPMIEALDEAGYRVWYDAGIEVGSSFPDYIANRLHDCACLIPFISRSSLASDWCRHEIEYALEQGKPILPVYLEDVELPRALQMRLGTVQSLFWHTYATDDEFYDKLFSARMLDRCLTPAGKRRRGVQPRPGA